MNEKWRWKIAHTFDKLPGMCWMNLVSWVLYGEKGGYTIRGCRVDWICRNDLAANGACYCGKMRRD